MRRSLVIAYLSIVSAVALGADSVEDLNVLKFGSGSVSIRLRFTITEREWTGTLLSRRAASGEPSIAVTAFKHEPFGKRFLGVALDGVADGPNQAAALSVRDSVVGGHLIAAFTEMDASLDSGTHDLDFRTDGKTAELYIDGVRRESRSAEKFTARTFLKLYPHSKLGWKTGGDPDGGDVFNGKVEIIHVQPRWLSDTEIGIKDTKPKSSANPKIIANGLYSASMSDEQRMSAIDKAMPGWLADKVQRDRWFPRYHVAIPAGMMFDTRCAIHGGRYHLFPTWRADMNLSSGTGGSFRMQHFSSANLIRWQIEPFPIRLENTNVCNGSPATIDGKPQFFFLRQSRDGAPNRALPTDAALTKWNLATPPPAITKEGEGYSGRLDSVVFQDGMRYYLTGTRRNALKTSMAMPLYRSDDLMDWKYIGDFFQTNTKPFNECPQIFHVGGKIVVAAFYPLHGKNNYLVGRFENERFVMEGGGVWDYGGHGHNRSFDAEPTSDGRVIGWSTITVYSDHDAIETARMGWKGMHSIAKEVSLRPDNTLALQPAAELTRLRKSSAITPTGKSQLAMPTDHQGQFELVTKLNRGASIVFATTDGLCTLSRDGKTGAVSMDLRQAPKIGADYGHVFSIPPTDVDEEIRVFFDRSVFEVFAGGYVMTSRYFAKEPSQWTIRSDSLKSATSIHTIGSIWEPSTYPTSLKLPE